MGSIEQAEKQILVPPISRGSRTAHTGKDKTYLQTHCFFTGILYREFHMCARLKRRSRQAAMLQAPPLSLLWLQELSPGGQLTGYTAFIILPGSPSQQLRGAAEAFLHGAKRKSLISHLKRTGYQFFLPIKLPEDVGFPWLRANLVYA